MTKPRTYLLYLALLAVASLWSESSTQAETVLNPAEQISSLVKQIQAQALSSERERNAQLMAATVRTTNASLIDDQIINVIASLLQDSDDIVRFNAARSLRYIGPRAKRTVPQLEAALNKIRHELSTKQFWTGTSSEDEICPALQRITGKAVGPGCNFSYRIDDN